MHSNAGDRGLVKKSAWGGGGGAKSHTMWWRTARLIIKFEGGCRNPSQHQHRDTWAKRWTYRTRTVLAEVTKVCPIFRSGTVFAGRDGLIASMSNDVNNKLEG